MNICYKCKQKKPLKEFYRHKSGVNKGYYYSYCKDCNRQHRRQYRKDNPWVATYNQIQWRCLYNKKSRYYKKVKVLINIKELKEIWIRDKAYLMNKPSIDRISSKGHYTLGNCRYIEHKENCRQGGIKRKEDYFK